MPTLEQTIEQAIGNLTERLRALETQEIPIANFSCLDLLVTGNVHITGNLTVDGAFIGSFSPTGNIIMPDDTFIGLGATKGRIVFDDTPTPDTISIIDADVIMTASRTIDGIDISAHAADANAHHDAITLSIPADTILGLTTQQITLDNQNVNTVLAGPTSGPAAAPTFRALVSTDLPTHDIIVMHSYTGGAALDIVGFSAPNTPASTVFTF